MLTQVMAFLAYMQGWSWPLIFLASTGVFLALTTAVAIVITLRQRYKYAEEPAALESDDAPKMMEDLNDEHAKVVERLRRQSETKDIQISARDGELETLKNKYEWLDEIVRYQRTGLRKYVLVENCDIDYSPLSIGKLYVEFTFHVRNYSMFYVSIPMSQYEVVRGSIYFKGDPLSGEAKLVENNVTGLEPCGRNYFKVRQWVNPDEAKNIPATLEKVGNLFDFSKANVYIRANKFPDDEGAKLDLTRAMQYADLENKIVALENSNALLNKEIAVRNDYAVKFEELTLALGTFYMAFNQLEQGEVLSINTIESLKGRFAEAMSRCYGNTEAGEDYDQPPMPNSVSEQHKWVDAKCFELRRIIDAHRAALSAYIQTSNK